MLDYIRGELVSYDQDSLVIESGGIGYMVSPSLSIFNQLPEVGEQVKVYLHLEVKEDDLSLYGFSSPQERELFRIVLSVSRIGPKTALTILSSLDKGQFRQAIMGEELATLTSVKGIGKKTARRLVVELKDKVAELDFGAAREVGGPSEEVSLAIQALTSDSMGFNIQAAREAVSRVRSDQDGDLGVEELVQLALKELS